MPIARAIALVHRASDAAAVRVAIGLGETTLVTLAPPAGEAAAILSSGLGAGAARAVRLWDDSLATTDYLGRALALAAAVRVLAEDLAAPATVIVCGDCGHGAVGPAVAERLGLPHLSRVIDARADGERLIVRRRGARSVRRYGGAAPAVLCVVADGVPLAAAEGAAPVAVDDARLLSWTLADAGLTPAELSYRRRFVPEAGEAPGAATPRRFDGVASLLARLRADGLVRGD